MKKVQITHHTLYVNVNVISAPHPFANIEIPNITQQGWDFRATSANSTAVQQLLLKCLIVIGKFNTR